MTEQLLRDYLKAHSQQETAEMMEIHQGTVSKMVSAKRDIRLVFNRGKYSHYYEVKIGKGKAA